MKKVLAISSVLLGVVFLAGCGQQPVSQTQPIIPAPVAQQPTQPVATQNPPASNDISWKTYVNKTSGYQITLPDTWKGYKTEDDGKGTISFDIKFAPDRNVFADGSSELTMFSIVSIPNENDGRESDCRKGLVPVGACEFVNNRLAKTSSSIIYYVRGDEVGDMVQFENKSSEIKNRFGEIDSILKTFQLTK